MKTIVISVEIETRVSCCERVLAKKSVSFLFEMTISLIIALLIKSQSIYK